MAYKSIGKRLGEKTVDVILSRPEAQSKILPHGMRMVMRKVDQSQTPWEELVNYLKAVGTTVHQSTMDNTLHHKKNFEVALWHRHHPLGLFFCKGSRTTSSHLGTNEWKPPPLHVQFSRTKLLTSTWKSNANFMIFSWKQFSQFTNIISMSRKHTFIAFSHTGRNFLWVQLVTLQQSVVQHQSYVILGKSRNADISKPMSELCLQGNRGHDIEKRTAHI